MRAESALILLNGEMRDARAVRAAAKGADVLICADGGARHAAALRLIPDFVVGDMDSGGRKIPSAGITFVVDPSQDRSDLDKALDLARRLGVKRLVVAGVRGGGLDHELVNFAALEESRHGFDLAVIDGGVARLLGPGRHALPAAKGARFSLLAAPRARVSLSGARFSLRNEVLRRGSRGLGNRAEGKVSLTVREGRVWVIDAARFRG